MTELPEGYVLRPPAPGELPAVQAVLDASETADLGAPCRYDMDVAVVAATSRLDLQRGFWVVAAPGGGLAAAGWLWELRDGDEEFTADHYVHPDHRDGPADAALIDAIEARVEELRSRAPAVTRLILFSEDSNGSRRESLRRRGYEHVRDYCSMRIDLATDRAPADWPTGIEVRPIRPERDGPAAHAASEDAFSEHFLFGPIPYADWHIWTLGRDDCDPSLWLLAWDGHDIAGQVWAVARDEGGPAQVGLVEDLSVRKPWRGRGLGPALLGEVFRLLGDRGCGAARLFVDVQNATGALRVYERAGMTVERHIESYARELV